MKSQDTTNEQLISELESLRRKVSELEESEARLKGTERLLRESEELHRVTIGNIRDTVLITDDTGAFTYVCPNTHLIFGYCTEEVVALGNVSRLIGDNLFDPYQLESWGEIQNIETTIIDKGGQKHTLLVNVKRVDIKGGTVLYVCRDITERKQSEDMLRASEEKYKTLFEESFDGLFITSPEGRILEMNKKGVAMFGYDTKEEVLRLDLERDVYAYPPDRKRILSMVNAQGSAEYDVVVKKKNGEEMVTHCSLVAVRDETGDITSYRGIIRDITERKRAEEALRMSEAQLSNAVAMAHLGHWEYDVAKDLFTFNDQFYKIFRTTAEEVGGYTMSSTDYARRFVHPDDRFVVANEIRKSIEATDPDFTQQLDHRTVYGDGEIGHISVRISLVKDELGRTVRTFGVNQDITDRKRAEERNVLLAAIVESSDDAIIGKTLEGIITSWNRGAEKIYGYKETEAVGKPVSLLVPPDRQDEVPQFLERIKGGGNIKHYESVRRKKDGREIDIALTISPVRNAEGTIVGASTIARDITERKSTEQALKASETRYRRLFEAAKDGILILDADTAQIVDVNPFLAHMLRYSREEMLEKKLWEIGLFADIAKSQTVFAELQSKEYACYEDLPIQTETGKVVNVEFVSNVYLVNGNKVIQCNIRDITDRKRADEALLTSETKYRSLFEESKDAIYLTARDGALVDANQAFLDLFGFTREEAADMNILKIYRDPADRSRFREKIEQSGSLEDYEVKFKKKDGTEIDCLLTFTLRLDKDGTIIGYQGIARDITERELLEKQLLQAQKMEAIGTLAGGIAHDFNNLLTVVQGFSELLIAEKEQDHPEYADLQKIFHAAQSGADLVKRLLMFSSKSEPKPIPINLNKEVVQVEKMLRRTIPKMIDIELRLSADLPDINADPSQVEQVLMNLAVNTRDAMPDGGKLTVTTQAVTLDEEYCRLHVLGATPGDYVLLKVSDTGQGMDMETVERIFEPFFTTKEMGKGTGLGLAMVYGIVKQHNGHITVYSEVGLGTTFRIYLPAIEGELETDVETTGIIPAFGTETVLLVDDEDLVSDLGARILTKHGYTVLKAANGREALDVFEKESSQISLVILDLIMPEMGGTECLKELLKIDPQVKILVASGYSADASVKETIHTKLLSR